MDHSEYHEAGRKMGYGGHAASMRPQDLTREQEREWLDGYLAGVTTYVGRPRVTSEIMCMRK